MKPCMNPQICGVQNHRTGTLCMASNSSASAASTNPSFGSPAPSAIPSSVVLESFEGFNEVSRTEFTDGQAVKLQSEDGRTIVALTSKSSNNSDSVMYVGKIEDLYHQGSSGSEMIEEYGYTGNVSATMGYEIDGEPVSRSLLSHQGQVAIDNGLWAVPGTPHAGVSSLTQFAENSAAGERGQYDWEEADDRDYPEGSLARTSWDGEEVQKRRYDPAFVLRDYAATPEGRETLMGMGMEEAEVHPNSPISSNPYGR